MALKGPGAPRGGGAKGGGGEGGGPIGESGGVGGGGGGAEAHEYESFIQIAGGLGVAMQIDHGQPTPIYGAATLMSANGIATGGVKGGGV